MRKLHFAQEGQIQDSLGLLPHRAQDILERLQILIGQGKSIAEILTIFNEKFTPELDDAEWTVLCYKLGVLHGLKMARDQFAKNISQGMERLRAHEAGETAE